MGKQREPLDLPEPTRLRRDWDAVPLDSPRKAPPGEAFQPWRKRGLRVEAAAPCAEGPRRYRVRAARVETPHTEWRGGWEYRAGRAVAYRRAEPVTHVLAGFVPLSLNAEELTPRQEGIAALMRQPPGGRNHGRARWGEGSPGSDPEERRYGGDPTPKHPDRRLRELDFERWDDQDFLAGKQGHGWNLVYVRTGRPAGRPRPWPRGVPETVKAAVVRAVGVEPAEFARLTRRGGRPRTREEVAARVDLGRRVARVLRAGRRFGVEEALAAAYGCERVTLHRLVRLAASNATETPNRETRRRGAPMAAA